MTWGFRFFVTLNKQARGPLVTRTSFVLLVLSYILMLTMARHLKQSGFTIVELLIVIVVIGILAAISIVAYNGVQQRARTSAASADLSNNGKRMMAGSAFNGQYPTTIDANSNVDYKINLTQGNYNLASYCVSDNGFVIAAEVKGGNRYYVKNGNTVVQDNTVNIMSPCVSLGVQNTDGSAASKTFMGMPAASCATENTTCTFSGTANIAYGSLAQGKFNALSNMTSPVSCSNATFGDPASGFGKACYVLSY
jgi:general secretion pathway protein G